MEGQKYNVRNMLIMEDDRKKEIEYENGDKFVILAAFPRDQKEISRRLAVEYNGLPVNSFSLDDRYIFTRDVTLDVLIEESPKWWTNAENCPDDNLKEWLHQALLDWSQEFQEKLKKNKFAKRGNKTEVQP